MSKDKSIQSNLPQKSGNPGVSLEKVVARIQQMMDTNSTVTHNEYLVDRVGNKRQYDVVIRGQFGGRAVLGVLECKDHSRKKGPDVVEAFAKKTENLGANLRVMVSRKGFTPQALKLAKHENIGCLSLLPDNSEQVGFSIGDMWYGVYAIWTKMRLRVLPVSETTHFGRINAFNVKWAGKPVMNWFIRELFLTYGDLTEAGDHNLNIKFKEPRNIEIEGKEYPLIGINCTATRVYQKKRKWVSWSGDAFYDWHTNKITIPANGIVVGSFVETDLSTWPDYNGEIPDLQESSESGFIQVVVNSIQPWDRAKDEEVPDLSIL